MVIPDMEATLIGYKIKIPVKIPTIGDIMKNANMDLLINFKVRSDLSFHNLQRSVKALPHNLLNTL